MDPRNRGRENMQEAPRRELGDSGNRRWCSEAARTGQSSLGRRRWHGTHCPRRLLLRDETSPGRRERERGQGPAREKGREGARERRAEASRAAVKQADPGRLLSSSFFCSVLSFRPARPLFLLLLSFARVLPCRGPCRVKTTYVPGEEAPGSRSVASRPLASSTTTSPSLFLSHP